MTGLFCRMWDEGVIAPQLKYASIIHLQKGEIASFVILDLLDLKLLLVIHRRGHTTKNGTPVDAMLGDTNCLCEGEVDDCEVLKYAVQPQSSWTAPWSRQVDSARGEVMQFQDFTFGWHTMQVTEPAQSTLRQGDIDWALFCCRIVMFRTWWYHLTFSSRRRQPLSNAFNRL